MAKDCTNVAITKTISTRVSRTGMTPFFFLDPSSQGAGMTATLTIVTPLLVSGYRGGMT
ncbi:hypothetical protein [Wolbachia endosymbiont (group A) of Cydia strobilella]|uniref:hypothetical protein n=1 Tax=Wolbachia endosymbiont (group A) of Cydia strobilella TaxID=3066170 RepID=UPI003132A689